MHTRSRPLPSRFPLLIATLSTAAGLSLHAEVKLPPAISSHMVLQRDMPVPIWGTADAGEEITIEFAGQKKTTQADATGKWQIKLDPLPASTEPRDLTVSSNHQSKTTNHKCTNVLVGEVWLGSGQSNMAGPVRTYKGKDPALQKTLDAAPYPRIRLMKHGAPGWVESVPAQVDGFSAILFAYGARLHAELGVPVGLMLGAVGGTPSGYWLTEDMFKEDAACQAQVKEFAKTYDFAAAMHGYERYMTAWKASAEKAKAEGKQPGREPAVPKQPGECREPFGHLYVKHVQPYIPYAIRGVLWDQGEGGTAITGIDQFFAMGALIKGWRKAWAQDFPFIYVQKPSGGGTAWDMTSPTTVNASPFTPPPAVVPTGIDGQAREVHLKIQQHPKTAMVISTDLGGMTHPTNKSGYADRAKLVAMSFVYDAKAEHSGPLYATHEIKDGKVRIHFTHTGAGLAARHSDKLQGFMIAGADKKFVWADAVIEGQEVVVSSPTITQPAAVRYAWSSNSPWANLFNKDGLPAQTFRTDDWKLDARAK